MIDVSIYNKDYINQKRVEYKCDPTILEKTIFACGLLEAITKTKVDFIFKGGSSLLFLLDKPFRLSTDIDIVVKPGIDILSYILKASETYPFIRYEENIRKGVNDIEKRHFRFFYKSLTDSSKDISVLLDVLFEENHYSKLLQKEIKNDVIKTIGEPTYVTVPSPESLLGDKLTAFAPKTIGVKPIAEKEDGKIIDKRIETIKQFFDCACLFDIVNDFEEVAQSYFKTAVSELRYRGLELEIRECLLDTFNAAASIMSRGKIDPDSYKDYLIGIRGLGSFLINTKFSAETARIPATKLMYLSACIANNELTKKEIPDQEFIDGNYSKLNYLRKLDKESFNLAAYAVSLFRK